MSHKDAAILAIGGIALIMLSLVLGSYLQATFWSIEGLICFGLMCAGCGSICSAIILDGGK